MHITQVTSGPPLIIRYICFTHASLCAHAAAALSPSNWDAVVITTQLELKLLQEPAINVNNIVLEGLVFGVMLQILHGMPTF